ncbi:MAG: CooT family nickel-binding protein [Candidatus Omnitrophota bacterium]
MCEVNAFKIIDGAESLFMEEVDSISVEGTDIILTNLKGEKRKIQGKIKKIDFLGHRLVIEE